ncbi:MAG: hypothetical protein PHX34_01160 [Candidatus Shapirobacteria bacterium]|nr:hypothetical protein [Candidatus Shapirobacteria bacterium]
MFKNIVKKLDFWDIGFTKLAVAAFVLALVALFPSFYNWVQSIGPSFFVIVFVLFAIRPIYRIWFKK